MNVLGKALLFLGYCDQVDLDVQQAKIEIYNHMIKWKTLTPRRLHAPSCEWTFKDTVTCRYAGAETWCDHSWERCLALTNSINFGGFRWLPFLQDKKIYWGRVPKESPVAKSRSSYL